MHDVASWTDEIEPVPPEVEKSHSVPRCARVVASGLGAIELARSTTAVPLPGR